MLKATLHRLYQKKAVIASLLFLLLFLFTIQTQAQNPWFNPSKEEHEAALQECLDGNVGLECTVQAIVSSIENSLTENIAPSEVTARSARNPGAIQFANSMITTLITNPPVSSRDYVQYLAQKINPVDQAYAQQGSTGFRALSALIKLWTAFRNIAYLAFVLIFIFIGFLIMFRARLDPQTVVNLQNSLPKLVVTLILITFSYAIAGFMVDLIYLGIFLSVSIFSSQGLISNPTDVRDVILNENVFTMAIEAGFFRFLDNIALAIDEVVKGALSETAFLAIYNKIPLKGTVAQLILGVAMVFSLFKLFFQLLMAYINIILSTILSPLMILFNALPGSQSFSGWIRNFLSNVLIFPAVTTLFLISAILIGSSEGRWQIQGSLLQDPNVEVWSPPLVSINAQAETLLAILGFGFILFAPQMVTILQQALKAKPLPTAGVFAPIAMGAGVAGRAVGVVASPVTGPIRAAGGAIRGIGGGVTQQIGERIGGEIRGRRGR